jgi:hypothetical protein
MNGNAKKWSGPGKNGPYQKNKRIKYKEVYYAYTSRYNGRFVS